MNIQIFLRCLLYWLATRCNTSKADNSMIIFNKFEKLPNFYMIKSSDLDEGNIYCMAASGPCTWQYPNGTNVPAYIDCSNERDEPVYADEKNGSLLRCSNKPFTQEYEGLYTCICETIDITAVLGVYDDSTFCSNTGPQVASPITLTDNTILGTFEISFNVTNGPPTRVNCSGPNSFTAETENVSRTVIDMGTVTLVTVTVDVNSVNATGDYKCTVVNNKDKLSYSNVLEQCDEATPDSTTIYVKVAETPRNFSVTRLNSGLMHVEANWTGSSQNYLIVWKNEYNQWNTEVNETSHTITAMLNASESYLFYVIAIGNIAENEIFSHKSEKRNIELIIPEIKDLSVDVMLSNTKVDWVEPDFAPSVGYQGVIICDNECTYTNFTETTDSTSSALAITHTTNLTDNCTLSLYGYYGKDKHSFTIAYPLKVPLLPPENVTVLSVEAFSMVVSWNTTFCSPPIDGYNLTYNSTNHFGIINITGGSNIYVNITGLNPYTNYSVAVKAHSIEQGPGLYSEQIVQLTLQSIPGTVSKLNSTGMDVNEIMVSWGPPILPNGVITSYELCYYCNESGVHETINTTDLLYKITGLPKHNSSYSVFVRARTKVGPGKWLVTNATTRDIESVTGFIVRQINDTAYVLEWNLIFSNALIGYNIIYTTSNSDHDFIFFKTNTSRCIISDLEKDSKYQFKIEAVYLIGEKNITTEQVEAIYSNSTSTATTTTPTMDNHPSFFKNRMYLFIISGSATAILLLLIITITVSCIIFTRKRKKRMLQSNNNSTSVQCMLYTIKDYEEQKTYEEINHPNPISINDFSNFVKQSHSESDKGFVKLFEELIKGETYHSSTISATPANKALNRFINITVYDDNRVILKPLKDQAFYHQNDYINASYIKVRFENTHAQRANAVVWAKLIRSFFTLFQGYKSVYNYIATQVDIFVKGPMQDTTVDFWHLIWQEESHIIVMVSNLVEDNRDKCHQYWPNSGSINFGPFIVSLLEEQIFIDYTVRQLEIQLMGDSTKRHLVTQHHFTSWPDHGVPQYSNSMMNFHKHVKENYNPNSGPMTVHCSAGVGRTGTFITIDMALQQIQEEGTVDIPSIINQLRHQRPKMVQTVDQFTFINDAILICITVGNTQINVADLRIQLHKMSKVDTETNETEFHKQFELLEKVTPRADEQDKYVAERYPERNRSMKYLPPEKYRIHLTNDEYIHASYISGYKKAMSFIVAENPMHNTSREFWEMIVEFNINVIIMIGNIKENEVDVCHVYWPPKELEKLEIEEFTITLESTTKSKAGYTSRILRIIDKNGDFNKSVIQYQITNWDANGEIDDVKTIIDVLGEACKIQRNGPQAPIAVHCSDTVTRSGIFCASATAIEKCKAERIVDVFQVVKAQRIQKPESVPSQRHFQLIFEIVQNYTESFELYSNFKVN